MSFIDTFISSPISRLLLVASFCLICSACFFPTKPGPGLEHFDGQAPKIGELAPDFTLKTLDGKPLTLSSLLGDKPLVLQFGSHSCPVYRYRRFSMAELYEKYHDDVNFLLVYTLEAHPIGSKSPYAEEEWVSLWNRIPGVLIPQHSHFDERLSVAQQSKSELEAFYQYPFVVDDLTNSVWESYGAAASPGYLIDRSGRIVLRQAWINPAVIDKKLEKILSEGSGAGLL